jgi:hypothetical protein
MGVEGQAKEDSRAGTQDTPRPTPHPARARVTARVMWWLAPHRARDGVRPVELCLVVMHALYLPSTLSGYHSLAVGVN